MAVGVVLLALLLGGAVTVSVGSSTVLVEWIDLVALGLAVAGAVVAWRQRRVRVDVAVPVYLAFLLVVGIQVLVLPEPLEIATGASRFGTALLVLLGLTQLSGGEATPRWRWPTLLAVFGAVLGVLVVVDLVGALLDPDLVTYYDVKNAVVTPLGASNYLAAFLLVATIAGAVSWYGSRERIVLAATVLSGLGLVATLSRGAFAAAIVVVVVAAVGRRRERLAAGIAAAAAVVLVGLPLLAGIVGGIGDVPGVSALLNRQEQFVASWDAFTDEPVLGVGLNRYQEAVSLGLEQPHDNAHNLLLHALAETGLLGAVVYLTIWVLLIRRAWRLPAGAERTALLLALLGLGLHAQIEALAFTGSVEVLLAVLLAVAARAPDVREFPGPLRAVGSIEAR